MWKTLGLSGARYAFLGPLWVLQGPMKRASQDTAVPAQTDQGGGWITWPLL